MTVNFLIEIDIEGLEIESVKLNKEDHYEIRAKSTIIGCSCHQCGKAVTKP